MVGMLSAGGFLPAAALKSDVMIDRREDIVSICPFDLIVGFILFILNSCF